MAKIINTQIADNELNLLREQPTITNQNELNLLEEETKIPFTSGNREFLKAGAVFASSNLFGVDNFNLDEINLAIDSNNDKALREKLSFREEELAIEDISKVVVPALTEVDLSAPQKAEVIEKAQPKQAKLIEIDGRMESYDPTKDVIERNAAEFIIDSGLINNPVLIQMGLTPEERFRFFARDTAQEQLATQFKIEEIRQELHSRFADQGIPETILDYASYLLIPLQSSIVASLAGERKVERSGTFLRRQTDEFLNMSLEERHTRLDMLRDELTSTNSLFGNNALLSLQAFEKLIGLKEGTEETESLLEALDAAFTVLNAKFLVSGLKLLRGGKKVQDLSKLRSEILEDPIEPGVKLADPPISPRTQGPNGPVNVAIEGGDIETAVRIAEETANSLKGGQPVSDLAAKEFIDRVLPGALHPESIAGKTITGKLLKQLENSQKKLTDIFSAFNARRLTTEERAAAIETTKGELFAEADRLNRPIIDTFVTNDDIGQISEVAIILGTGRDGLSGFQTVKGAKAGAKRLQLQPGSFDIIRSNDQFNLVLKRTVGEGGFIEAGDITANPKFLGTIPLYQIIGLRRGVGSKLVFDRSAAAGAELSVRLQQGLQKAIQTPIKIINKMSQNQKKSLMEALTAQREQTKWFTVDELNEFYVRQFGREAAEKEIAANISFIQLSNFAYLARNNRVVANLAQRGFQEAVVEGFPTPFNGKIVENIERADGHVIFNVADRSLFKIGEKTEEEINTFINGLKNADENTIIVKVAGAVDFSDDVRGVEYIITTRNKAGFTTLRPQQLPYLEGGPVIYAGKNFVKQQRIIPGTGDNTGTTYIGRPKTHFAIEDFGEAETFATSYNKALESYRRAVAEGATELDIETANRIISEETYFASFKEFDDAVKQGTILDSPFEVVADRGLPTFGRNLERVVEPSEELAEVSDEVLQLLDSGRAFYSRRGERLLHPLEGTAPVIDPVTAMAQSLNEAVRTKAFGDFTLRQAIRFNEKYGNLLEGGQRLHPITRALTQPLKSEEALNKLGVSTEELARLKNFRNSLRRLVDAPTPERLIQRRIKNRVLKILTKERIENMPVLQKQLAKIANKAALSEKDAFDTLRGIAFDAYLGMGDISQVIVQSATQPGVIAAFPKSGIRAYGAYPWVRAGLIANHPDVWARIAKLQQATTGIKPKQFLEFVEDLNKSNTALIGGTQAALDQFNIGRIGTGPFIGALSRGREAARFFFTETEKMVRTTAFTIAWLENGGRGLKKAEDIERVALLSETISGNMTRSSNSFWQRGSLAVPTQFLGFQARYLESTLFGTELGLTAAQRARFVGGLTLFYGATAVVPLANFVYDKMIEANDGQLPDRETHELITRGILSQLVEGVEFTGRAAPLGGENLISKLLEDGADIKELMVGPSGQLATKAYDAFVNGPLTFANLILGDSERIAELDIDLNVSDITSMLGDMALEMAQGLSGAGRATRGYHAFRYNEYISKKSGDILERDLTTVQKIFIGLGFPPVNTQEGFETVFDIETRTKALRETADIITKLTRKMIRAGGEGDDEKLRIFAKRIALLMLKFDASEEGRRDARDVQKQVMTNLRGFESFTEEQMRKSIQAFGLSNTLSRFEYREKKEEE